MPIKGFGFLDAEGAGADLSGERELAIGRPDIGGGLAIERHRIHRWRQRHLGNDEQFTLRIHEAENTGTHTGLQNCPEGTAVASS